MKELSIEEKAKRYDEALKVLHKYDGANIMFSQSLKEEMFPELAESEDERIRNEIIKFLELPHPQFVGKRYQEDWIAWLEKQKAIDVLDEEDREFVDNVDSYRKEIDAAYQKGYDEGVKAALEKQGEQNHADKVEPKFHKGDWIVFNGFTLYVKEVVNGFYRTISKGGITNSYDWDIDNVARLWTIQDVKYGDVLEFGDHGRLVVGIVSYINKNTGKVDVSCLLEDNKFKIGNYYALDTINPHPATKEQRDALIKAMTNAGYTFDFEKKELKKLEDEPTDEIGNYDHKKVLQTIINEQTSADKTPYPETLEKAIDLYYYSYGNGEGEFEHLSLEKFRDIVHTFVSDYGQKPAWSEEDEKILKAIHNSVDVECLSKNGLDYIVMVDWFKSLKDRVQPQNRWKPSDEQMDALHYVTNFDYGGHKATLVSLYEQLKKLREE